MNKLYVYVGALGALGAATRYALGDWFVWLVVGVFPAGTLACNLLGSFLLAALFVACTNRLRLSRQWQTGLGAGFLGSFTTFSAVSAELLALVRAGALPEALAYAAATLIGGTIMSFAGIMLAARLSGTAHNAEEGR